MSAKTSAGKVGGKTPSAPRADHVRMIDALILTFHPPPGGGDRGSDRYLYDDLIILDEFARVKGFEPAALRRAVTASGFFALEDISIKHGTVFTREVKHKAIVEAAGGELERALKTTPIHVAAAASRDDRLYRKYRRALDEGWADALGGRVRFPSPVQYQQATIGREALLGTGGGRSPMSAGSVVTAADGDAAVAETEREISHTAFPGGAAEAAGPEHIAGPLRRKLPRNLAFTFSDGTVARSMETWVRALAGAREAEVRDLLMGGRMEEWLRSAGQPDLADAARSMKERLDASGGADDAPVKARLFRRFRETGAGEALYVVGAGPYLERIAAGGVDGPAGVVEAVAVLGGRLAVEPLLDGLFSSTPGMRRAIIAGLGELRDRRATPKLIKMLEFSTDRADRLAAVDALGRLGDPRAVEALGRAAEAGGEIGEKAREVLDGMDRS